MIVDMLTKGLGKVKFERLREMTGIVPLKNLNSLQVRSVEVVHFGLFI